MRFSDVSPEALEKVTSYRFDRFIEKHEGPERWDFFLEIYDVEFLVQVFYDRAYALPFTRVEYLQLVNPPA